MYREDADCDKCKYSKKCGEVSNSNAVRVTVREYVRRSEIHLDSPDVEHVEPERLSLIAYEEYVRLGGNIFPRWNNDVKWVRAMETVNAICQPIGWDASHYVKSQLDMLSYNIEMKRRLCPGHFTNENARQRYKSYLAAKYKAFGVAATDKARAAKEAELRHVLLACFAYVEARIEGNSVSASRARALDVNAEWSPESLSDKWVKAKCVEHAVSYWDSTLPDRVLMPLDCVTFRLSDILKLVAGFAPVKKVEHSPELTGEVEGLGEFL